LKFSIIHPTARVRASFEFPWWRAFQQAHMTCRNPRDVEYVLVVHHSRIAEFWRYFNGSAGIWGSLHVVTNWGRDCLVDQGNSGRLAATGEIIIGSMDDLFFPDSWDKSIAAAVTDTAQPVAVHCLTGSPRDHEIFIPPVYTKVLSDLMGPTDPEYDGMFTDDEQTILYRRYGTVIETDIRFEHRHPAFQTAEMDEIYALENRREAYAKGLEVFRRRQAFGFPRVELPGWTRPAPAAPPVREPRTIAFCCPGEQHRAEWEIAFWNIAAALAGEGWIVRFYFGYTTNVYATRAGMARDVITVAQGRSKPDLVLWIDDDNTPTIEAVRCLIQTLDQHPEFAAAAGWCWIRSRDEKTGAVVWMPSVGNFREGSLYLLDTKLSDLYADNAAPKAIEWTGFPCLLMRYEALELLGPVAFAPIASADNEFGFTGEDIAWCVRARERGLKLSVDPRAKVEHWKAQPIEPDYRLADATRVPDWKKTAERLAGIERDRARRNGDRYETDEAVRATIGASM
jgi:hypothetical protein